MYYKIRKKNGEFDLHYIYKDYESAENSRKEFGDKYIIVEVNEVVHYDDNGDFSYSFKSEKRINDKSEVYVPTKEIVI